MAVNSAVFQRRQKKDPVDSLNQVVDMIGTGLGAAESIQKLAAPATEAAAAPMPGTLSVFGVMEDEVAQKSPFHRRLFGRQGII